MARTYELTEREALLCFAQVNDHISALHNYVAFAVERGDTDEARNLVKQIREHQELFKKLNVEAHRFIDAKLRAK